MYQDKTNEELLALFAAAIQTEFRAVAGFGQADKTVPEARENLAQIRQELLRRLQAGKLAQNKLQKFLQLAKEIETDSQT